MDSKGSKSQSQLSKDPYFANLQKSPRQHNEWVRRDREYRADSKEEGRGISLREEDVEEYQLLNKECSKLFASEEWAALLPKSERRVQLFPDSINALKMFSETLLHYSKEQIRRINGATSSSSKVEGENFDRLIDLLNKSFDIKSRLLNSFNAEAKPTKLESTTTSRQHYDLLDNKHYNHPLIHEIVAEIALCHYLKGDAQSKEVSKRIATELLDSIESFSGSSSEDYVINYKKISICQENY